MKTDVEKRSFFQKVVLGTFQDALSPLYRTSFFREKQEELEMKLEYAGISDRYTPREYLSIHVLGGLTGFLLSLLCGFALLNAEGVQFTPAHSLILVLLFTGAGFFIPTLKLNEMINTRRKEIMHAFPFTLDLITISVEAGMDFSGAVQRIVDRSEINALTYELYLFLHETKLGKRKVEALRRMADRIDIPQVTAIITSLIQAEELGMSIGQILRIQSLSMRTKRMQTAEKKAMEAPVKMLIPLAIFIFPAVFIVLLGPMIIQFMSR
jgi:tight adherence protein C